MKFTLYILKSKSTNKFYVGHTNNMERRVFEHNSGQTKSTKPGIPWELVYTKEFQTNIEANRAELDIKKKKSRKYIEQLISGQSG
ncbi:MAG: GIY-YIG nuclease family protein [Bacteroidetes bacterium]|nr:GIY-YIG nuclease family protein [Bacteroidota bacterium]